VTFSVAVSTTTSLSFQWRKNGSSIPGATSGSYTITNVQTTDQATYFVNVTNAGGSVTSSNATLTILGLPVIMAQPSSQSVVLGGNVSLSVTATSTVPISYQWNFNNTPLSNATNSTLVLTSVQTNQAGIYSVVLVNSYGTTTSSNATLTVLTPPFITTQPQSLAVTVGQTATFSVAPGGTAPLTYQWYFNGSSLGNNNGARTATYSQTSASTGNAGNYTVVVNNSYGSVTSAVVTLTVYVPPSITSQPANQTVVQGQNATFSVTVSSISTQPMSYQWNINGVNLPWATNASLTITNAQANDAGSYFVMITNLGGSATSSTKTLTVNIPAGIVTQPQDLAVLKGQIALFTVVASGSANLNYQWYFNGTKLTNSATSATFATTNVQTTDAGNYTVVVKNNWGMVTSTPAILAVYVPPTFSPQPGNQTVVQGGTATFTTGANGTSPFSYQWYFNGASLTDGPNLSGSISNVLTLSNVSSNSGGNYTVVVTNLGGSATSHVATLTVNIPAFITSQPTSLAITQGQTANFSVNAGGTPNLNYQWYFNGVKMGSGSTSATLTQSGAGPNNVGTYYAVVANNYGSVTSAVVSLTALISQPINQTVGIGQSASFFVGVSNAVPINYQWTFNGTNLPGATNPTLTLNSVTTNLAGSYAAVITTPGGVLTSSAATLTTLNAIVSAVINLNDSGPGSLRQAIINANIYAGTNAIVFNIPGSGPFTISALSLLPAINNNVLIDATTQPGYAGNPVVQLSGSSLPNGTTGDGLTLNVGNSAVKGLSIYGFPGNGLTLSNGSGSVIQGNDFGWNLSAAQAVVNGKNGIMIYNSASNVIGGASAGTQNVVVTSGNDGIHIEGTNAIGNRVLGNIVGMLPSGTGNSVGAGGNGIVITNASGNFIGGTNAGAGNVSSGNNGSGLFIAGSKASLNVVQGNYFGTDITGTNAAKNSGDGITILNSSSNTIGGLTFTAGNVLSGNGGNGISITGPAAQFNLVQGNFIGCDQSGTVNLKNDDGVLTTSSSNNTIGGLATGAGNVIAFNSSFGVVVNSGQCAILMNSLNNNGNGGDISLLSGSTRTGNLPAVPPVLTGASNNFTVTWVSGVLTNTPGSTYRIEFYASPNLSDAQTFLGATNIVTANTGIATFKQFLTTGNIINQYLTATATDVNGNTSQISVSQKVSFNGFPAIVSPPQSVMGLAGKSTNLTVVASGLPAPAYQWYFQSDPLSAQIGSPLIGQINSTLAFTSLTTNHVGNYTVVVGNGSGSVTSAPVSVTLVVPVSLATQPMSQTVIPGASVNFSVVASGTAPFGYQWTFNNDNLVGATNAWLTVTNVQMAQAGSYAVVVTNLGGAATGSAVLTVTNPIITLAPVSGAMTPGGFSFQLSVPAGRTYVVFGSTNLKEWTPLVTNLAVTASEVYLDATAPNYSQRFYRVMVP